jgi:hypothetical protein
VSVDVDMRTGLGSYDGLALTTRRVRVPETALVHAVGRPLGDLMTIHPAIDHRIVKTADAEPGGVEMVISFEPSLIEFAGIADAMALYQDADS